MDESLQIGLLETFRLAYKGQPVPAMNSPRLQELLAYLLLHRDVPRQRQQIACDLWPESLDKQTLANLRQLLYQLRNALPDADNYIWADTNTIQWKSNASFRLDVAEFEQLLKKAQEARESCDAAEEVNTLKKAVPLYRGPLLSQCLSEWIIGDRNRLQEAYVDTLERLVDLNEEERKYEEALSFAQKLLEHDPCNESACRRLLQLHALNEDRAAVIQTYKSFEKKVREDLDIEPGPKTRELYQRLCESFRQESGDPALPPISPTGNGAGTDWPMVGRKEEWKTLLQTWDEVRSGSMQWVLIRGETGIGKSRLGSELLAYLSEQGYPGARARCYEAPGTPGYGPVADWLRSPSFSSGFSKLNESWLNELSRLLPEFSGRLQNAPDSHPWQQRRFEEALAHAFLANDKPALLLLNEVQWCDSQTLGWLDFLLNQNQPTPFLVVATLRTTAGNPYANEVLEGLLFELRQKHCLRVIEPNPLDRSQTLELASHILGREISESMNSLLYHETEGNPLFIVEMARELNLLDQLTNSSDDTFVPPDQTPSQIRELPSLVSEVISRRFRYLSPESREVLGIAAVAGREFSFKLISHSCDLTEDELIEALEELIRQYIFKEVRADLYDFTHDKLREVAYKELSNTRRRRLHLGIAGAIKAIHEYDLAPWHKRLAFHYERAGEIEAAINHYLQAALHAREVTSLQDVGMLRRSLELLANLPESPKRDYREFELTTSLAISYLQRRRFDTEEVFQLCEQVYRLGSELGEPPPIEVLFTLGIAKLISGDPAAAVELGIVMYTLAKETGNTASEVEACYLRGLSNRVVGNISESARWYREGLEKYKENHLLTCMQIYDVDGSIILRMETAVSILLTGSEKEARELMERTIEDVRTSDQALGNAYICYAKAWFEALARNEKEVREAAEQFLEFEIEREPMHWSRQINILLGWAMAAQGSPVLGTERIQTGIDELEERNHLLDIPFYYVLLAESLIIAEEYSEARKAINSGKKIVESTEAGFAKAEIFRAEGKLFLAQDAPDLDAARTAFSKAIEIAQNQGSRLFERHASLAQKEDSLT